MNNSHSVAATRLVWTAVIRNNSETSGPLLNGRILKMYTLEVYIKSFGGEKGGSSEPLRTPLAYGPDSHFELFFAVRYFRENTVAVMTKTALCIAWSLVSP